MNNDINLEEEAARCRVKARMWLLRSLVGLFGAMPFLFLILINAPWQKLWCVLFLIEGGVFFFCFCWGICWWFNQGWPSESGRLR